MAAKRRGGPQQMKGFRPGKEPAHLKKRMAKAQLGNDATWAQKKAVDAFAGQSPQDVKKMVQKWSMILFVGAVLLAVGGFFLYGWAIAAGVTVHVLSAVMLFLGYRIRKQGDGLAEIARSL